MIQENSFLNPDPVHRDNLYKNACVMCEKNKYHLCSAFNFLKLYFIFNVYCGQSCIIVHYIFDLLMKLLKLWKILYRARADQRKKEPLRYYQPL